MEQLYRIQLWVRDTLIAHMDQASDGGLLSVASILPLGVLFGALHAMTPGHSKTVLASYLLGSDRGAVRSLPVAGLLSLTHVGTAVILALVGSSLITKTLIGAGRAPSLEAISRGLLIAIGAWLFIRSIWHRSQHRHEAEGFGIVAGLIPCPLTLFVMFAALARGQPELGLLWALGMAGGVMVTLGATAAVTVFARNSLLNVLAHHGTRVQMLTRAFECAAGILLIVFALRELIL